MGQKRGSQKAKSCPEKHKVAYGNQNKEKLAKIGAGFGFLASRPRQNLASTSEPLQKSSFLLNHLTSNLPYAYIFAILPFLLHIKRPPGLKFLPTSETLQKHSFP